MTIEMKPVRDTFENVDEAYAYIAKGILDKKTVADFVPALNEIEVDIYNELMNLWDVHPDAMSELFSL